MNPRVFEVQTRKLLEHIRRRATGQSESSDSPYEMRYREHVKKAYGTNRLNQEITSMLGGQKKKRKRSTSKRWVCNGELKNMYVQVPACSPYSFCTRGTYSVKPLGKVGKLERLGCRLTSPVLSSLESLKTNLCLSKACDEVDPRSGN